LGEQAHAVEFDDDGGSFVPGDAEWPRVMMEG
jgi:hypothetical protein